jgi:thiamine-monophosphate kinase
MRPWVDRFYDGFLALADAYETPLAGGDLAQSPLGLADIVLVGAVSRGKALLRSGARPGHVLYVTGTLGGAAAGLEKLKELAEAAGATEEQPVVIPPELDAVLAPHLRPQPRIAQGLWLRSHNVATAALDISDGLSTDLAHLCEESGVAAEINTAALPIYPGATLVQALHGGDDYELLFSAHSSTAVPGAIEGVPVTRIGRILRREPGKPQVFLRTAEGAEPLKAQGWEHFSTR